MNRVLKVFGAKRAVPILMYHQVSNHAIPTFKKYTVSVHKLAMQVAWMAHAGYTSVTFETLLACSQDPEKLPRRPVIITFDDGYVESVKHATRILGARKFTAYYYLVAGLMGKCSEWLHGALRRCVSPGRRI